MDFVVNLKYFKGKMDLKVYSQDQIYFVLDLNNFNVKMDFAVNLKFFKDKMDLEAYVQENETRTLSMSEKTPLAGFLLLDVYITCMSGSVLRRTYLRSALG